MKTVEEPSDLETIKVQAQDLPTGGPDVPKAPRNEDRTDIGDPLATEYNKGDLHNHPSHVTGSGGGAPFRSYQRGGAPGEALIQDYIRFSAKAASEPGSLRAGMFDTGGITNGVAKNFLPFNPGEWNLPETQSHRTLPYLLGNKGTEHLLNNPVTRYVNRGPVQGALAGAATVGGLGALGVGAYNAYQGYQGNSNQKLPFWKTVLLASLAGAGMGALSGWQRSKYHPMSPANVALRKQSSEKRAFGGDAQAMIQSLQGSGLPFSVLEHIVNFLVGLAPSDARALRQLTGGLGGAALGMFLAKKLGLGSLLTAGLGLAGASTGFRMLGGEVPRRQRMTDLYGQPF